MRYIRLLITNKKYLLWSAVIIAGAVLVKATVFAPQNVQTVKIETRDLSAQVYGNGTIEAKVVVGVSSKITGKIVELHADQGDSVKRGQLLARLENDDLTEQVRQTEALVLKARASQRVESATLRKAKANLIYAEHNLQRFQKLEQQNYVPRHDVEQFDNAYQVAKEEIARSQAALDAARMEEASAKANQQFAQSKLSDTGIYAPHDGLIITRDLERGSIVTPGQTIFTFTDPDVVWSKANVDESQMKGVAVGQKALISLRSSPGEQFEGSVARIAHQSDRVTEESEVDVSFATPRARFRLGEQSDVYIVTGVKKGVPSVPSAAIVSRMKKRGVWVLEHGALKFVEIRIGIQDRRGFTEVLDGIDENAAIAFAPPQVMMKFEDGLRARVQR